MAQPQSSKKRPVTNTPGMKLLITAASLAATLGGWSLLSNAAQPSAGTPSAVPTDTAQAEVALDLPPLPTLVPPPQGIGSRQAVSQPAPAVQVPAKPALRAVARPPAPVTVTRSSR